MARHFLLWSRGLASPLRYTLLELLVVTAVVAIIISLLLPAVNKGRAVARKIKCAHNMRELGKAAISYTQDYVIYPRTAYGDLAAYGMKYTSEQLCPQTRWMTVNWGAYGTILKGTGSYHLNSYTIDTQPSTFRKPKILFVEGSKTSDGTCWWGVGGSTDTPNSYNQYVQGWCHGGAKSMAARIKQGSANWTFTDGTVPIYVWDPYAWNFNGTGTKYSWGNRAMAGLW